MGERVYIPTKEQADKILKLIGETNDSGGGVNQGSLNAKLNAIISTLGTVNSNTNAINTSVGVNSDPESQTGFSLQSKLKYAANTISSVNTNVINATNYAKSASENAYNAAVNISNGVKVIRHIQRGTFEGKVQNDGDRNVYITLSGFSDSGKMIALINGLNTGGSINKNGPYIQNITYNQLHINVGTMYQGNIGSYQVIEFY